MTSEADVLPGQPGFDRETDGFFDPRIQEVAERVTADYLPRFAAHGATLLIRPLATEWARGWFRREHFVADGLIFVVLPQPWREKSHWLWWVEQESAISIRERNTKEEEWTVLFTPEEIEVLLRKQAETYLRQFAWSEAIQRRLSRTRWVGLVPN